ncbi:MAG TPA: DUF5916 domain-containing protein [Pyrinomonadaceae bacterium]|nr:DUF5916 domain-containing protein [Pyrinomonadaceae bacterium]
MSRHSFFAALFLLVLFLFGHSENHVSAQNSPAANGKLGPAEVAVDTAGKLPKLVVPPEKLRPQVVPKIAEAIVIDGRPDEQAWQNAVVLKDFYQTYPGDNIEPSRPTEVLLMYDEKHLYIAFKCWDEKDKVRATVARRDNVFGEDNVRVWLDTYNDQRRAYVLGFNPLGIQQDGIHTEGQGADFSVDIVMESKGVIEDWGWSVEVKIPFKSLRYSAGAGKMWGFNAARNIDRFNDEFNQWLPDDRNVSGFLVKHGKLTGLDEIKYERTLEIVPSVTLSQTGRRTRVFPTTNAVPDRFVNNPIQQDIGVTVKYNLSPNITLDAAYNPDFAEIEADAPVVTANQRFPIFFQEKRPFFLEGAEIFNSPLRVFNSRAIVDPDVAAKLTGKIGRTSFGFLAASDKAPGNYSEDERNNPGLQPRIREFLDRNASFAVIRVKRDFGKEHELGFFGTYRDFVEQKNAVGGIDGRLKLTPRLTSQFQVVGTHSRRCFFDPEFEPTLNTSRAQRNREICGSGGFDPVINQTDPNSLNGLSSTYNSYRVGNGVGYYANLDYSTDRHGWFVEVGGRSSDYRADSGFTRRTNSNFVFFFNRFSTKSNPKATIIRASWAQFSGINYDWKGRLQSNNYGTNIQLNLPRSTFINIETGLNREKIYEEEFGLKRSPTRPLGTFFGAPDRSAWQHYTSANLNQNFNKQFNYGFFVGFIRNAFDFFFFEPSGMQNPGPGQQFDAQVWFGYRPITSLRMSANYTKSRMVRNDNKVRSFDSDIVSMSSTYQFTRFIFTRVRVDYDGTRKNTSGQVLFGWNPSPGKAFYVGYNDNFNYDGFNPFTGLREPGFQRNSRTFFIRASYSFKKSF